LDFKFQQKLQYKNPAPLFWNRRQSTAICCQHFSGTLQVMPLALCTVLDMHV